MPSLRAGLIYKPVQSGSIYALLRHVDEPVARRPLLQHRQHEHSAGEDLHRRGRHEVGGGRQPPAADRRPVPGRQGQRPDARAVAHRSAAGAGRAARCRAAWNCRLRAASRVRCACSAPTRSSTRAFKAPTTRWKSASSSRTRRGTPPASGSPTRRGDSRLGVGPRFMGRRYGNNTNTRQVDGYCDARRDGVLQREPAPRSAPEPVEPEQRLLLRASRRRPPDPGPSRYAMFTTNFHF